MSTETAVPAKIDTRAGWPGVSASFLALMVSPAALLTTTFGVLAAGLAATTGWTHSSIALGSTIISLVVLATSPVQGYLIDRLGGRRLVLISLPVFAASLGLLTFATTSIQVFYLLCAVAALAGIGLWPGAFMKVVSGWFDRRLGIMFGILNCGIAVSVAIFPLLLGQSFATIGWAATYALAGVVVIAVVWPMCWRWLREAGPEMVMPTGATETAGLAGLVRARAFWIAVGVFLALGIMNAAILVHGVAILRAYGLSPSAALGAQALVGVGAVIGRLGAGWLLDRVSVRVVGSGMFALAIVYFVILSGAIPGAAPIAALCAGLVTGAEFDVLGVLIRRYLGNAVFGRAYGLTFGSFQAGGAIGSGTLALLLANTGSFAAGFVALIVLCALCGGAMLLLGPQPRRAAESATEPEAVAGKGTE